MSEKMKKILVFAVSSFLAGVFIGVGGTVYLKAKELSYAPFLFSIGLVGVVTIGLNLYTGKIGYAIDNFRSRKVGGALAWYAGMLGLNIAGAGAMGWLQQGSLQAVAAPIAQAKIGQDLFWAFFMGILCGMMMYLAVQGYIQTKNIFVLVFPVAAFIYGGFNHCVADAFYFCAAGAAFPAGYFASVIAGNTVGAIILNGYQKAAAAVK